MRAKLHLGTEGVLAQVALGSPGRFAAFDDLVTLTVRASDGNERHGPFLPHGGFEDEAQGDSNRSPAPLLKHYQMDNGPESSGKRTQFLQRMVAFCDAIGKPIQLLYYPPYHSKYNPIERCWGLLELH